MATTTANLDGVVINEVHQFPSGAGQDYNGDGVGDATDEYAELYNTSASSVDISGWQYITSTVNGLQFNHTFEAGTVLAPGGFITIVDPANGSGTPQGVQGTAVFGNGENFTFGNTTVHSLFNPSTSEFVLLSGSNGDEVLQPLLDFYDDNGAVQVGPNEQLPVEQSGVSGTRVPDGDTNIQGGSPTPGTIFCFAPGTHIATPAGERTVETLAIGDLVLTADGRAVPVRFVWRHTIDARFARSERHALVRITAGALGPLGPTRDLIVTADHGIVLDGVLCNASALVDGVHIIRLPHGALGRRITVYHVETEQHEAILAEGLPAESFIDVAPRHLLDNFAEYEALYGAGTPIAAMDCPRILTARQLTPALRARGAVALAA